MIAPARIQLSRRKGFDLQVRSLAINCRQAVVVARPTQFGNPFVVGLDGTRAECVYLFRLMVTGYQPLGIGLSLDKLAHARQGILGSISLLRGKNLACWCPLEGPCHADVLLEIANR